MGQISPKRPNMDILDILSNENNSTLLWSPLKLKGCDIYKVIVVIVPKENYLCSTEAIFGLETPPEVELVAQFWQS